MFEKLLKVILGELNLKSFEFGGMTFTELGIIRPSGWGHVYELKFHIGEQCVSLHFDEDCSIHVESSKDKDINHYIGIDLGNGRSFIKDIPRDSYIRLDIEVQTLESLVKNGIGFNITDKEGNLLASINADNEDLKFERIQDYLLIKYCSKSGSSFPFKVRIPEGSEIRIYL